LTSDYKSVDPVIKQISSSGDKATEQGPSNKRTQIPSHPTSNPQKRGFGTTWHSSPSKRTKVNTEYIGRFRASDIYRPSGYKGPAAFVHSQPGPKRLPYRNFCGIPIQSHAPEFFTTPPLNRYFNDRESQVPNTLSDEGLRKNKQHELKANVAQPRPRHTTCERPTRTDSFSNSPWEPQTPVVTGPSYTEYLRKKENDPASPLTAYKLRTTGHIRTQSYIGSEEGEIVE
jgi:hypothetical protein